MISSNVPFVLPKAINEGMRLGPRQMSEGKICKLTKKTIGVGVYMSPDPETPHYGCAPTPTKFGDKMYEVAIMCKVKPDTIRVSENYKWVVEDPSAIKPCRICFK